MQLTSGVAVPVRRDVLLRYRQTLGVEVPWDQPGLSRSERVIAFLQDLTEFEPDPVAALEAVAVR
jgi:hypothetical protein